MSATRKTTWSRPMTRGADWVEEVRVARVPSSGMAGSFLDCGRLLRCRGAPLRTFGAGGAMLRGAQNAVMVGIHPIEPCGGAALCAFHRMLDILVARDVAAACRRGARRRRSRRGLRQHCRRAEQGAEAHGK